MKEQLEKIKLEALDRMEAADSLDTLNEIRLAGTWSITEISRSPYKMIARVLGMGVALMTMI